MNHEGTVSHAVAEPIDAAPDLLRVRAGDPRILVDALDAHVELELDIEYELHDDAYLFFVGTLTDDSETVETAGTGEEERGLEINELGFGYLFGERVVSELTLGRMEFVSASEWWVWWDEELDAVRLQSSYSGFASMLAYSRALAPDMTNEDFIDPEEDDVGRALLSLAWYPDDDQALIFYYISPADGGSDFEASQRKTVVAVQPRKVESIVEVGGGSEYDVTLSGH